MTRGTFQNFFGIVALTVALIDRPAYAATPAAYDSALSQVQTALGRQAEALHHGTTLPAQLTPAAVAARVLSPMTFVERPGQPPEPVDVSLLLATLRTAGTTGDVKRRAADIAAVSRQIVDLRRDVSATVSPVAESFHAEREARAVLASRMYASDPLPPPSLFERFTEWLDRMWRRLFHRPRLPSPTMPNISLGFIKGLVIILGVGAFAVLVAVFVQWLRRRPARAQPLALDETEAALVEARDTDSLRALAEQKAQQGDYRLALRFVYLALLVALDTGGVVRFDRSKTNWEYLRVLRTSGRADVYDAMAPLTREFDRVWYGFARADSADYERALAHYDSLQAAFKASSGSRPTVRA